MPGEEQGEVCPICLVVLEVGSPRVGTCSPCNHLMHGECVFRWCVSASRNGFALACPTCRSPIDSYAASDVTPDNYRLFGEPTGSDVRTIDTYCAEDASAASAASADSPNERVDLSFGVAGTFGGARLLVTRVHTHVVGDDCATPFLLGMRVLPPARLPAEDPSSEPHLVPERSHRRVADPCVVS